MAYAIGAGRPIGAPIPRLSPVIRPRWRTTCSRVGGLHGQCAQTRQPRRARQSAPAPADASEHTRSARGGEDSARQENVYLICLSPGGVGWPRWPTCRTDCLPYPSQWQSHQVSMASVATGAGSVLNESIHNTGDDGSDGGFPLRRQGDGHGRRRYTPRGRSECGAATRVMYARCGMLWVIMCASVATSPASVRDAA